MGNPSLSKLIQVASRVLAAVAVAGAAMVFAAPGSAGTVPVRVQGRVLVTRAEVPAGFPAFSLWHARTATLRHAQLNLATLQRQSLAGQTIPFWTSQVTSPLDSQTYTTSMVGTNPFTTQTSTTITYIPIVVIYHFPDGTIFDPTHPACGDTSPMTQRFFNSPIFQPSHLISNGVDTAVGTINGVQAIGGFQRANFWQYTHGTNYNVQLLPGANPKVVNVFAPRGSATARLFGLPCGSANKPVKLGLIDLNLYDFQIESLIAQYAKPNQLPIVFTYNVVQFFGTYSQCCIIGYHNAVPFPGGTQTYAVGSYTDSGIFQGLDDIGVWTHEIGEWMDDPFTQTPGVPGGDNDDLTPPWGDTGQVFGACQNNLEVGDPLTGTEFAVPGYGSFTYHLQDLAFEDWFYRTPSKATGGRFSEFGTFTSAAAPCSNNALTIK